MKIGYCRLCWCQASAEAKAGRAADAAGFLRAHPAGVPFHQLFFDRTKLRRTGAPAHPHRRRGRPPTPVPTRVGRPVVSCVQPPLLDIRRDLTGVNPRADPDNPWLAWARYLAHQHAEARGWTRRVRLAVLRGLVIVLSGHAAGDTIRHSEVVAALRDRDTSVGRVCDVLAEMGVLLDDRHSPFNDWVDGLDGLAPGIRGDVEAWLRALHLGTARTRPRAAATIWSRLHNVHPALVDWSTRYDHLREVTTDDVRTHVASLHGAQRRNALGALRSLFAFCRRTGSIFRDPARDMKVGQQPYSVVQPLASDEIGRAVAAATTPADRLVLALAALHAARTKPIRELLLTDVDLGNRSLVIAGRSRPLDDLTHQVLVDWLTYRRTRWPNTANPHLIINQQTAMGTGPAASLSAKTALRGQAATLERLRVDRQLEEALTHGPDPLHLAVVFGLDPKTAIRYAHAAQQLLTIPAEAQHGQHEPKGPPAPRGPNIHEFNPTNRQFR